MEQILSVVDIIRLSIKLKKRPSFNISIDVLNLVGPQSGRIL
jgi:hypothetical protein